MIFAGIFPHVCKAHGKERLIDLHVFHTFSSYCVSKVTPAVCVKDTKCQPVKLSFLLYAEVAALQPPLTAQTLYKLLRESKPGTVAHLSQNQLGWVFSGKLHFLFCWLNIDLPFKPLWWYYSVKLIFLLVFLEPLKISYVVRNNLSLIKRGIELFWFFNLELWFICHLTVRRNRWFILRSFFVNRLLPLLLVFLRGFDLNQHSAKKFRTQTGI